MRLKNTERNSRIKGQSYSFLWVALGMICLLFVSGCSTTGRRALEKGRYYDAVVQSVEKLKKDPGNAEAKKVLHNAYGFASDVEIKNIDRALSSSPRFRFERVVESYRILNKMYDMIERCPACRDVVTPESYHKQFEVALDKALAERYSAGVELLEKNTITAGREAYKHFIRVAEMDSFYKDIDEKLEDALFMGSYHVVVEKPKLNSRLFDYSYGYFQDRVEEFLNNSRSINKFVRFYNPEEAESLKLKPDHIVRLEFVDFVVGQTVFESETTKVVSKDSVKVGTVKIEGKDVDVFNRVEAQFTMNKKTVDSRGIMMMEIFDARSMRILKRYEMPGRFTWVNEWAYFNGDERALSKEQKKMVNKRDEMPPTPQQLFLEICKPIYQQFKDHITRFYNNLK